MLKLKDLTAEVKEHEIKEEQIDGVKLLTATADTASVSSISLSFDLSHLTPEELLYLKFYSGMINNDMATYHQKESLWYTYHF